MVKASGGHPMSNKFPDMSDAASAASAVLLCYRVVPTQDFQTVAPTIFNEQKPAEGVPANLATDGTKREGRCLHRNSYEGINPTSDCLFSGGSPRSCRGRSATVRR